MSRARGNVAGAKDDRRVVFYGLSTCIWCKRTRRLLEDEGVAFEFVYVDLLQGKEREEVIAQVRDWSPTLSFPTIVVDDSTCVVGYKPEKIEEVLGL